MNSISLRRLARRALFAVIWLSLALALVFSAGLRFNPTPSLPKGVYRIIPGAPEKNELVSFVCKASSRNWLWSVAIWSLVLAPPGCGPCSNVWPRCRATLSILTLLQSALWTVTGVPCLRPWFLLSYLPAWPWCWPSIPAVLTVAISGLFPWIASSGSSPFLFLTSTTQGTDYDTQRIFAGCGHSHSPTN